MDRVRHALTAAVAAALAGGVPASAHAQQHPSGHDAGGHDEHEHEHEPARAHGDAPASDQPHHDGHVGHGGHGGPGSHVTANLGVVAGRYRSMFFDGAYQGTTFGAAWARGRFAVGASGAAYRIDRNGKTDHGVGDLLVHGNAVVLQRHAWMAGLHAMVMVPTGDDARGLGMGHVMLMSAMWSSWSSSRGSVSVAAGFARGVGDGNVHAEHGNVPWPLVEPMNFSEVTFDASAMLVLARGLRVGPRVFGAQPTNDDGTRRVAASARVSWREGRVDTNAELQGGLAGDPFEVRGVLSSMVRF